MTTTLPTPADAPRRAAPDPAGFVLAHRALRSATRLLARAADGVARDDVCDRQRQRRVARFARAVLPEVRAHFEREDPAPRTARGQRLVQQAESALPVFARCASAGAPLLAPVLAELAELVEEHLAAEDGPARSRLRLRPGTTARRQLFLLPWLADQCHPAELSRVLAGADPRTRLLLRLGTRRYTLLRDAVLG